MAQALSSSAEKEVTIKSVIWASDTEVPMRFMYS
jgi:hypothetical protein